jgi:hypothetical protein
VEREKWRSMDRAGKEKLKEEGEMGQGGKGELRCRSWESKGG